MLVLDLSTKKGSRYYLIKSTINGEYESSSWLDKADKYKFEVSKGDTIELSLEDTATGWEGGFLGLGKNSLVWNSEIGKIELTGTKVNY